MQRIWTYFFSPPCSDGVVARRLIISGSYCPLRPRRPAAEIRNITELSLSSRLSSFETFVGLITFNEGYVVRKKMGRDPNDTSPNSSESEAAGDYKRRYYLQKASLQCRPSPHQPKPSPPDHTHSAA
jgi:hypothetical protein